VAFVLIPLSLHSGTKATHFYELLSMALAFKTNREIIWLEILFKVLARSPHTENIVPL